MKEAVDELTRLVEAAPLSNQDELEQFRLAYLAKSGRITDLFAQFKQVPPADKPAMGQALNQLKVLAETRFKEAQERLSQQSAGANAPHDLTLPNVAGRLGSRHPLSITMEQMINIFRNIGFDVSEGPEIEDDWHNFSALNFPENHPAREMQDTFFISAPDVLLRTHTSPVQARVMESTQPPIRTISPGRVYRNETVTARAHCLFHQVEGLYIDRSVSFADLKQTIYYFVKEFYGPDIEIRFRPSFFPFTEPSAEIDISCLICKGRGCNICKYTGYVEIGGSGMVHPNVLKANGIDPSQWSGFAFGMGVERACMLKYGIKDLRLYYENDMRFIRQFEPIS